MVSHAYAQRARILLLAADGLSAPEIARRVGCTDRTVRTWRARFRAAPRVASLRDRHRTGRPAKVSVATRCRLVQLACERPDPAVMAFRDVWTYQTLADGLAAATGTRLSVSEVGRILRFEQLRPHRIRQWLHSPDPDFVEKAERVCAQYLEPPAEAVVVCVDEKPLVIRSGKYPTRVGRGAVLRREFEYRRHGTATLFAAFAPRTGHVFGRVEADRTARTLVGFMEQLAVQYPTGPVTVVWDNLNIHYDGPSQRWTAFNQRHGGRFQFVYTPLHASWLNQVEIWFSILERRLLRCGDFTQRSALRERIHGFIDHWNTTEGHPFKWTWRTDKLHTHRGHAA